MIDIGLKKLSEDDIDDEYCSWFENQDGHLNYYTGSGRIFTKEVILSDFKKSLAEQTYHYYLIFDKDNNAKIGNVKIGPIDVKNKTSDLVCFIGNRNYLGKGLASKAIQIANQIAFDEYDIRRLHGGMIEMNVASIKAYTRAGWVVEATLEGYYYIEGKNVNRICVCCLNPKYFPDFNSQE